MSNANLKPLQDAIKLIADVVQDTINAMEEGNSLSKISDFSNILPDLMVLLPEIGEIPNPATLLPDDYAVLVGTLTSDLVVPGKAGKIVDASLKLLSDIIGVIVPDVQAVIAAAES